MPVGNPIVTPNPTESLGEPQSPLWGPQKPHRDPKTPPGTPNPPRGPQNLTGAQGGHGQDAVAQEAPPLLVGGDAQRGQRGQHHLHPKNAPPWHPETRTPKTGGTNGEPETGGPNGDPKMGSLKWGA